MSVAFVAVARAAREARPRTRVTRVHVPERPLEDPATSQLTAELPAVVVETAPRVVAPDVRPVATAPRVVAPEVEPEVFARTRTFAAAAPVFLGRAPAGYVPQPVVPAPRPERPPALPDDPTPDLEPEPERAVFIPEPDLEPEPEPAVFVPEPPPPRRLSGPAPVVPAPSLPERPDQRWGWTEPWGFAIPAPARPAPPRRRHSTKPRRATKPRRGAKPRGGAHRRRRAARRRRAHAMIPLVVIALAVAAGVWIELPRGGAAVAAPPLHTAYRVTVTYTPHPSAFARETIPSGYLQLYWRTANQYGLDWTKLAAVGQIESDQGRSQSAGVAAGTNPSGAAGPAQFVSTTWATYGVDADGRGSVNPYDPADAIATMARYLKASGAPQDWSAALFAYNHSYAYVDEVLTLSRRYLAR